MNNHKVIKLTKNKFKKLLKEDNLFVLEKYLPCLPTDWIDCIEFLLYHGIEQNKGKYCLMMDDKETEKFVGFIQKKQVKLIIISEDKEKESWQMHLLRKEKENEKDREYAFLGGEYLRKYCDEKNLFYASFLLDDKLLSSSTLMFLKHPEEDCRIPLKTLTQ